MKDGGDQTLDSLTMRITGGTDHILRTYVDELTGVSLVVLVLFGPAEPVLPHVPEVCYPANGFRQPGPHESQDRVHDQGLGGPRRQPRGFFRSSVYEKSGGLSCPREESFHSFRLEGQWSPDVGAAGSSRGAIRASSRSRSREWWSPVKTARGIIRSINFSRP